MKKLILLSLLIGLILFLKPAYAEDDKIYTGSQLRPIQEQINDLRKQCKYVDDDTECKAEIKRLEQGQKQLSKLCMKNPFDVRCDHSFRKKKEIVVDDLKTFCMRRPFEQKCIQQQDRQRQKNKYCLLHPASSRCVAPEPKIPRTRTQLQEFCTFNPRSKYCTNFQEVAAERKRLEELEKGIDNF